MTLYEAIFGLCPAVTAPNIVKHLKAAGIGDWEDMTVEALYNLRDELRGTVAPNTVKTYLAEVRRVIKRHKRKFTGIAPEEWGDVADLLKSKGEKPVKAYLTLAEIERLAKVKPATEIERWVQAAFLCGCYTGARVSDIRTLTAENFRDGNLEYVSKKTGVHSVVPAKPCLRELVGIVQKGEDVCLMSYNRSLREMARRAGITETVKIYKAGETRTVPKYEAISSHTARISFCTNLVAAGASIADVSRMAGHTSPMMTARYVCEYVVKLPQKAMQFFL